MIIVNTGEHYTFVGEREDVDKVGRGIASLALAAYGHDKFHDADPKVLTDLVLHIMFITNNGKLLPI